MLNTRKIFPGVSSLRRLKLALFSNRLLDDHDLQIAITPRNGQTDIFKVAVKRNVDPGVCDRKVADFDSL